MYISKNYSTDNGDTLVIGGKLIVKEEAEVEGISTELPVASAAVLGGVKVGTGLNITQDGTLSAASASLSIASADTFGGVKVGSGLDISADGVLSVSTSIPIATKETYGTVKMIAYHAPCTAADAVEAGSDLNVLIEKIRAAGIMAPQS